MPRVTQSEVRAVLDTDLEDLSPFITAAGALIEARLESQGLDENLLKEIERWLSAHFAAMRERQAVSESIGDASAEYGGSFGLGLDFTQYGQQVKVLDVTGTLAGLGKRKASILVL